tara:strand:+ start:2983 stop:3483 length:501 start_codon:yes stop_codon:yes gene_type:complete
MVENAKKRAEEKVKKNAAPEDFEETTTFHGTELYDYKGRSYVKMPNGTRSYMFLLCNAFVLVFGTLIIAGQIYRAKSTRIMIASCPRSLSILGQGTRRVSLPLNSSPRAATFFSLRAWTLSLRYTVLGTFVGIFQRATLTFSSFFRSGMYTISDSACAQLTVMLRL